MSRIHGKGRMDLAAAKRSEYMGIIGIMNANNAEVKLSFGLLVFTLNADKSRGHSDFRSSHSRKEMK
jgi:hypothetical protein